MSRTLNDLSAKAALVEIGQRFYQRGWMWGTAGNLSAHRNKESFWITASGLPKGSMDEGDFLAVDIQSGEVHGGHHGKLKPSAETSIHRAIYRHLPDVACCLHMHSVPSCVATERCERELALPAIEMLKGLDIWDEHPQAILPVFDNHGLVPKIAEEIEDFLRRGIPKVPAVMIRNHGITVWGSSPQQAFDRAECLEFIFAYLTAARG